MNPTCQACGGECCKGLLQKLANMPGNQEWARLRGATVTPDGWAMFPVQCSALGECGECTVYDNRPETCKKFEVGGFACNLTRQIAGKL